MNRLPTEPRVINQIVLTAPETPDIASMIDVVVGLDGIEILAALGGDLEISTNGGVSGTGIDVEGRLDLLANGAISLTDLAASVVRAEAQVAIQLGNIDLTGGPESPALFELTGEDVLLEIEGQARGVRIFAVAADSIVFDVDGDIVFDDSRAISTGGLSTDADGAVSPVGVSGDGGTSIDSIDLVTTAGSLTTTGSVTTLGSLGGQGSITAVGSGNAITTPAVASLSPSTPVIDTPLSDTPPAVVPVVLGSDGGRLVGNGDGESIVGSSVRDVIIALGGPDEVIAGAGDDLLFGGRGGDLLEGQSGDDRLFGRAEDDTLFGGIGDDRLFGGSGGDEIFGGGGGDVLFGDTGHDALFGGAGDRMFGGDGNDALTSQSGSSFASGGLGDDTILLRGTEGTSRAEGGLGADLFDIDLIGGTAILLDFDVETDRLDLSDIAPGPLTSTQALSPNDDGSVRITATGGDITIIHSLVSDAGTAFFDQSRLDQVARSDLSDMFGLRLAETARGDAVIGTTFDDTRIVLRGVERDEIDLDSLILATQTIEIL